MLKSNPINTFMFILLFWVLSLDAFPSDDNPITATLPEIPNTTFLLARYGGVGDGKTMNTEAFNKAIAALEAAGGGHLVVPTGIFKTLPIKLVSRMELHLEEGAVIKAPETFDEYGLPDPGTLKVSTKNGDDQTVRQSETVAPLISGFGLEDVAITGSGTIDGSGALFWPWSEREGRKNPGRPVIQRPILVMISGKRLHFDGVTLLNSPKFHLVPSGEDITIENLKIIASERGANTDAMDPRGKRIVIRHCLTDVGDDNVALQSGSSDILIEDMTCLHGHGISIGSYTMDGINHAIIRNCTFNGTHFGLRIKSARGRGGEVHNIHYSNITMKNVSKPFYISMLYTGFAPDIKNRIARSDQKYFIPHFHDIHINNLTSENSPIAGCIIGIPEQMVRNISFTNVKIQSTRGFLVQDAKEVTFNHAEIEVEEGEPLLTDNAEVILNGKYISGKTGGSLDPFY